MVYLKGSVINMTTTVTKEKIVSTILNSDNLKEVIEAWNKASRSDPKLFISVCSEVSDTMVNICQGKDPRFTLKEVLDHLHSPISSRV